MKLIILQKNNEIVAISESKTEMVRFFIQNNLSEPEYVIRKIRGDIANTVSIVYDDLYIEEYSDGVVRRCDVSELEDYIYTIHEKVQDMISMLSTISEYTIVSGKKDADMFRLCADTLMQSKLNISALIKEYYEAIDLRNENIFTNLDIGGGK